MQLELADMEIEVPPTDNLTARLRNGFPGSDGTSSPDEMALGWNEVGSCTCRIVSVNCDSASDRGSLPENKQTDTFSWGEKMAPWWWCQTFAHERDKTEEHAVGNRAKLVVLAASKFRSYCDPSTDAQILGVRQSIGHKSIKRPQPYL